jgi:cytochrome c oxidase cbb3-type subunit 1
VPLLGSYWRGFAWPEAARPWLRAALAWWTLLVASGWVMFLPRVSEALKFTHALVAHAHLAMAGVVTSVNGLLLTTLLRRATPRGVFGRWQAGCALYVAAMLVLGVSELERSGELFRSEPWTQALLAVRLVGGLLMVDASGRWLTNAWEP